MSEPGTEKAGAEREALEAAAASYWRLWRRNWRAPFPPEDAPPGMGPSTGPSAAQGPVSDGERE